MVWGCVLVLICALIWLYLPSFLRCFALALALLGWWCLAFCAVAGVAVVCEVRGAGSVIGMGGMVVVVMVSVGGQLPEIPAVKYAVCSVLCCVLYLLDIALILGLFYSSRGILYAV